MAETVKIVIEGEDKASKAFAGVNKSLGDLEKHSAKASGGLGDLAGGIGKVGLIAAGAGAAGVLALGGAAVSSAMNFEKMISSIKAVSGASTDEIGKVQALALQLGKDTAFSASEAASGIEELIKGGVEIPDVLGGAAKSMLDLAAAGSVALPDAAEIASNAMAMFGLKGKDMAHVADLIAGAANASSLSVMDFKFSLQMSGAMAKLTGQSFDDLAVSIALMGKMGIKGSDAGTSLKTMMMNLVPSTKNEMAAMMELGIVTADGANKFVKANGEFKSMAEIAQVLQDATKDLTQAEKQRLLGLAFGSDAIRAATVLSEQGAKGFDEMAASMGKVTAASVGAEKLNNLAGSFEQLKGSLETAAITLGLALLPAIRAVVDGLTALVNAAIPVIESMGPGIAVAVEQAGQAFGALMAAVQPLIAYLQANWEPIMQVVAASLAAVAAPLIVAAGLAFALYQAWQTNFLGIQTIVTTVINTIVPFILNMVGIVVSWWQENLPLIQRTVETVMNAIQVVTTAVLTWLTAFWQAHGEQIVAIVQSAWTFISTLIEVTLRNMLDLIKVVMQIITGDWDGAWRTIQEIQRRSLDAIIVLLGASLGIIVSLLQLAWDGIVSAVRIAWGIVSDEIGRRVAEITAVLDAFIAPIRNVIGAIGDLLGAIGRIPSSISLPSIGGGGGGAVGGSFQDTATFWNQPESVQASFYGSYGSNAPAMWQAEHEGALGSFQHGGSFVVGGQPGIDKNLVNLLLTKGERVDITPAGQAGAGRVVNIYLNGTYLGNDTAMLRELARLLQPELDRQTALGW